MARRHHAWLAAGIVVAALALRLYGIGFGLPALNDPDELIFELGAVRMLRGLTLNPGWFGHPATTTMELLALINAGVFVIGRAVGWFASNADFVQAIYRDPSWVILPGRVLIALFAAGTVAMTYRLARAFYGVPAGLAAAALLAVNPVHVTYSQIIRADMTASFFSILCFVAALRIAREDRWRDYVWASLWLGLAIASKWPFVLAGLGVCGAAALRFQAEPRRWRRTLVRLGGCFAMSIGFLLLVSPYILLDYPTVLRDVLGEAQGRHLGATGGAPWMNAIWYLRDPILGGLGVAGFILFVAGVLRLRRSREAACIVGVPFLGFLLLLSMMHFVWERWALPLMPLAAIVAAPVLVDACRWARDRLRGRALRLAGICGLLVLTLVPPALQAITLERERMNDTRQQAARWMAQHVAPGSTVMVEQFAFDLLAYRWRLIFPLGDAGCIDTRQLLAGQVSYAPISAARGNRSIVDYGTLAPARRDTCRADYAIIAQYDRYRAESGAFPEEFASYRELLARGRQVAVFAPVAGEASGPVIRIIEFGPTPSVAR